MTTTQIAAMEKELVVREAAAAHLSGIPKQQNANSIARLYDALCAAHIEMYEAAHA